MRLEDFNKYFFIGIAGTGMSALAQFLKLYGKEVAGSDRIFTNQNHFIKKKFDKLNIKTFPQGKSNLEDYDIIVVSTAIEKNVFEYKEALRLGKKIIHRSELLSAIAQKFHSIAVGGTSGKSTTTAMIFHILDKLNQSPSFISGSEIISEKNLYPFGNSFLGKGKFLVFEADESDGTIVNYKPNISLILNLDKDHKQISELKNIFSVFAQNTQNFVIKNFDDKNLSFLKAQITFGKNKNADYFVNNFKQEKAKIFFKIKNIDFQINTIGFHNALNAAAAIATTHNLGFELQKISKALKSFKGIKRRLELIYDKKDILIFDDYAHNPAKINASLKAIEKLGKRKIVFFQPHGFAPLKFFYTELIEVFSENIKNEDILILAPVFYAGGTVNPEKDSQTLAKDLKQKNVNVILLQDKFEAIEIIPKISQKDDVIIIMGARDISLPSIAQKIAQKIDEN